MGRQSGRGFTFDTDGLITGSLEGDELADSLLRLGPKIENRIVNRALKRQLDKLALEVVINTPEDSGELADSITLKRKYKKKDGAVLFDIASRGEHSRRAHLTEWGRDEWTGKQKIRGGGTRTITLASTRPGARMFTRAWDKLGQKIVPNANADIKLFVEKEWKKIDRKIARDAKKAKGA